MHHCPDCLREVADLVKHRSEYHSLPSPVIINGEPMTVLRRDGRLICPVPQCGAAYKTRTSFKKHVDTNHATSDSLLLANGASATSSKRPAPEGSPEATKLPKRRKLLLRSLRDAFQRTSPSHILCCFHILSPRCRCRITAATARIAVKHQLFFLSELTDVAHSCDRRW